MSSLPYTAGFRSQLLKPVTTIREAQRDGIWAWDCHFNEAVLIFPVVLALLGDNPMQSEMASHIGLRGRKFCRACHVEGTKGLRLFAGDPTDSDDGEDLGDDEDELEDVISGDHDESQSRPSSPHGSDSSRASRGIQRARQLLAGGVDAVRDRLRQFICVSSAYCFIFR